MFLEKDKINFEIVLLQLGFSKVDSNLVFDFGDFKLKVIEGFNESMSYGYNVFGQYYQQREGGVIHFSLPINVESFEMGVSLLSYYLKKYSLLHMPSWFQQGLEWKNHLPWERDRMIYDAIPKAEINREWFKLINKELRIAIDLSKNDDFFNFSFDGEIFKIVGNNCLISCAAKGAKWKNEVTVNAFEIKNLPIRITSRSVLVFVEKDKLRYDRYSFKI